VRDLRERHDAPVLASGSWNGFDRLVSGLANLSHEALLEHALQQEVRLAGQDARLAELTAAHEALTAEHEQLKGRYDELTVKLARLEHLLSRNSGNSSMPSSTDDQPGKTPPKRKDRGGQKRAKDKQKGAPGANLSWSEAPEAQRDRFPEGTCGCGADLTQARDLGIVEAFQQIGIPEVRAKVTQYDQHAVLCRCGRTLTAARPEGAGTGKVGYGPVLQAWAVYLMVVHHVPVHRCRQLLTALTGAEPSIGFVHGLLARTSKALREADRRIRALITLAAVVYLDETPLRAGPKAPRAGRKAATKYLLIACTRLYTHSEDSSPRTHARCSTYRRTSATPSPPGPTRTNPRKPHLTSTNDFARHPALAEGDRWTAIGNGVAIGQAQC
jgi:transposase